MAAAVAWGALLPTGEAAPAFGEISLVTTNTGGHEEHDVRQLLNRRHHAHSKDAFAEPVENDSQEVVGRERIRRACSSGTSECCNGKCVNTNYIRDGGAFARRVHLQFVIMFVVSGELVLMTCMLLYIQHAHVSVCVNPHHCCWLTSYVCLGAFHFQITIAATAPTKPRQPFSVMM
jgi:hypothetical protein